MGLQQVQDRFPRYAQFYANLRPVARRKAVELVVTTCMLRNRAPGVALAVSAYLYDRGVTKAAGRPMRDAIRFVCSCDARGRTRCRSTTLCIEAGTARQDASRRAVSLCAADRQQSVLPYGSPPMQLSTDHLLPQNGTFQAALVDIAPAGLIHRREALLPDEHRALTAAVDDPRSSRTALSARYARFRTGHEPAPASLPDYRRLADDSREKNRCARWSDNLRRRVRGTANGLAEGPSQGPSRRVACSVQSPPLGGRAAQVAGG